MILGKDLENCKNVATILPENESQEIWRNLTRKLRRQDIYAENITESDLDLVLIFAKGPLLAHHPSRLMNAHEMGLWRRWSELENRLDMISSTNVKHPSIVAAANTKGNIIVIFVP